MKTVIKATGVLVIAATAIGFATHLEGTLAKVVSCVLGTALIFLFLYVPKPKN